MNSLATTLRPFQIEINREKRSGGSRHIEISARPESARRIAPIAPNAPNAAAGAENAMIDCATTRPIAPGASEGGGGRGRNGRNGRNSTASFWETDDTLQAPHSLLATRPASDSWDRVGSRASVRSCCVARRPPAVLADGVAGWCRRQPQIVPVWDLANGFTPGLHTSPAPRRNQVYRPQLELQSRPVHRCGMEEHMDHAARVLAACIAVGAAGVAAQAAVRFLP